MVKEDVYLGKKKKMIRVVIVLSLISIVAYALMVMDWSRVCSYFPLIGIAHS
jgi:hypothetical protein